MIATVGGGVATHRATVIATANANHLPAIYPYHYYAADGGLDWRIVAIISVVTALTVLQFGLIPAIDASRSDPMSVLRGFSPGGFFCSPRLL